LLFSGIGCRDISILTDMLDPNASKSMEAAEALIAQIANGMKFR
jgi:hypothetical protein